jgi:hypothetical protein
MPAYSFQERFVPLITDGSKNHTIRKRRARGFAKKDDTLYLYYGMRTKNCKKLREEICTDVHTIFLGHSNLCIANYRVTDYEAEEFRLWRQLPLNSYELLKAEKDLLAWRDGFRPDGSSFNEPWGSFELMLRWWKQTHELPFVGDIIYWQPK